MVMKKKMFVLMGLALLQWAFIDSTEACTGITLKAKDGSIVAARTIEWGGSDLRSTYVVVPRGFTQNSLIPGGKKEGMSFKAQYGYIGFAVEQEEFVTDGINDAGLSAGLFYFPRYGEYEQYNENNKQTSIADLQLVPWILGCCKSVDDVINAVNSVHVIGVDPRASTAHWRFMDASGRQVVLEITNKKAEFFENTLGVLTNSPGFQWHLTNLNNYVNMIPGTAAVNDWGEMKLTSFGVGSGFLGLPGDVTPPSRFVRAAFYQTSAPQPSTAVEAVRSCFQILNNFDIPIGAESTKGEQPADIPSATQWTSATDVKGRKIYYRTMRNSAIRCIDLNTIDFTKVKYSVSPLDEVREQPIINVKIK